LVVTEHDFDFIKRVATTITVLNKGEKLAEGTVDEIACDLRVRECYLGREDARDQ
jgi:urea transport system ATP-binding protein